MMRWRSCKMNRDELLSKISVRMREIQTELDALYQAKKKLVDEQTELIASWQRSTNISKDELIESEPFK